MKLLWVCVGVRQVRAGGLTNGLAAAHIEAAVYTRAGAKRKVGNKTRDFFVVRQSTALVYAEKLTNELHTIWDV